jgi:hypothetical protein
MTGHSSEKVTCSFYCFDRYIICWLINVGQSPVEPSDYQGLQLDTRAKESTEKYVDAEKAFIAEAEARELVRSNTSRTSAAATFATTIPAEKRICGVRRRYFWFLLAFIVIIVIVAAVVGGVVSSLNRGSQTSTPASPSTSAAPTVNGTDNGTGNGTDPGSNVGKDIGKESKLDSWVFMCQLTHKVVLIELNQ